MEISLYVLAVVGFAAVLWRFLRAVLQAVRVAADAFLAREMAGTRAFRGDLTGMAEAQQWARSARRARWRTLGEVGVWLSLLAAPPLLPGSPVVVYASYGLLWLAVYLTRRRAGTAPRRS